MMLRNDDTFGGFLRLFAPKAPNCWREFSLEHFNQLPIHFHSSYSTFPRSFGQLVILFCWQSLAFIYPVCDTYLKKKLSQFSQDSQKSGSHLPTFFPEKNRYARSLPPPVSNFFLFQLKYRKKTMRKNGAFFSFSPHAKVQCF